MFSEEKFERERKIRQEKSEERYKRIGENSTFFEVLEEQRVVYSQQTHFFHPRIYNHKPYYCKYPGRIATAQPSCEFGQLTETGIYLVNGFEFFDVSYSEQINDLDFSYCEFRDFTFDGVNFCAEDTLFITGSEFSTVNFNGGGFKRYQFKHCVFYNVHFSEDFVFAYKPINGAIFDNCYFFDCHFLTSDIPAATFYNCKIKNSKWPDFRKMNNNFLDHVRGDLYGGISFLYEQISKGYQASKNKKETLDFAYLSKKYDLYSSYFSVPTESTCLKKEETFKRVCELYFKLLLKDLMSWIYYYVMGFAVKPLRVLPWYLALVIFGFLLLLVFGIKWDNSLKLVFDAIFTYGPAFVTTEEGTLNPFQLFVFYGVSFLSLVLNGLFISTLFYYLTYEAKNKTD